MGGDGFVGLVGIGPRGGQRGVCFAWMGFGVLCKHAEMLQDQDYDCVSRYFAPVAGIEEDPVTINEPEITNVSALELNTEVPALTFALILPVTVKLPVIITL